MVHFLVHLWWYLFVRWGAFSSVLLSSSSRTSWSLFRSLFRLPAAGRNRLGLKVTGSSLSSSLKPRISTLGGSVSVLTPFLEMQRVVHNLATRVTRWIQFYTIFEHAIYEIRTDMRIYCMWFMCSLVNWTGWWWSLLFGTFEFQHLRFLVFSSYQSVTVLCQ